LIIHSSDALFRAVESAIRCNYRPDRLHIFLAFDEASETPLYFALLKKLKMLSKEVSDEIKNKLEKSEETTRHVEIFPPRLEWYIEGVRVTICRFPHAGKSPTQGKAFKLINETYGNDEATSANTLILFIDSDIILHENAIHNFVQPAVANPKIKGMTGLVTCRTRRNFNFYQYLQDSEYIDGQMFNRTAEAVLGAVTCLPGALTLIRLNALQKVAPKYFIEIDKRRTVDFHRFHLGEDRYMTYLLTEEADGPYQVKFISSATCKTDAPDTFTKLIKQRRRWFLGGFVNDVNTLISPVMWTKVPMVVLMKAHFYSSKGVDWIFPIMIISIALNQNPGLALYLLVGVFVLRYILVCFNALIMSRNKVCVSYVFLFFLSPVFNWIVTIYAVWTWSVRSWGGPRTDTDGEDEVVSPIKVLEEAMAQKEEGVGKTRRSLAQIETVSRIIHDNLGMGSVRSVSSHGGTKRGLKEAPLKKFVPFPYQTEFLGGGGFKNDEAVLRPPSPTLSLRSLQQQNTLSPSYNSQHQNQRISKHSASMPDIHANSQRSPQMEIPYLFAQLDPSTQRRASSFKLDTELLARVEELATRVDSDQRGSSFNLRLSGKISPTGSVYGGFGSSREPSLYSFRDGTESLSKASTISADTITGITDALRGHDIDDESTNGSVYYGWRSSVSGRPQVDIVIQVSED
jgi:cellulose synthase/poly-beta-1,6-N-acetylglucosamine synthase-like glycosyltransferase